VLQATRAALHEDLRSSLDGESKRKSVAYQDIAPISCPRWAANPAVYPAVSPQYIQPPSYGQMWSAGLSTPCPPRL